MWRAGRQRRSLRTKFTSAWADGYIGKLRQRACDDSEKQTSSALPSSRRELSGPSNSQPTEVSITVYNPMLSLYHDSAPAMPALTRRHERLAHDGLAAYSAVNRQAVFATARAETVQHRSRRRFSQLASNGSQPVQPMVFTPQLSHRR